MKSATPVDRYIGRRIRECRRHRGLSQTALAQRVGVSWQQIQKYEDATSRVSASRLYDIAKALGVLSMNYFFPNSARRDMPRRRNNHRSGGK